MGTRHLWVFWWLSEVGRWMRLTRQCSAIVRVCRLDSIDILILSPKRAECKEYKLMAT
jgi:hypothetical protein